MFQKVKVVPTMNDVLEVYKSQAVVCDEIAQRETEKINVFKAQLENSEKEHKLAKNFGGAITAFLDKMAQ